MTIKLEGVLAPLPSPVTPNGEINVKAVEHLVEFLIRGGIAGLIPVGGVGEYTALSPAGRARMVEATVVAARGRVPVIAGVVSTSLHEAVDAGSAFKDLGADALLVVPPFYQTPTMAGVRQYFSTYRKRVDLPLVLYDSPQHTHLVIDPATLGAMVDEGSLDALKASNRDLDHFNRTVHAISGRVPVVCGETSHFAAYLAMGADGGMIGNACLMPRVIVEIYRLAHGGKLADAFALQRRLFPLSDALSAGGYFPSFKRAMSLVGIDAGDPLMPFRRVSDAAFAKVEAEFAQLRAAGLIDDAPVPA
jgi:4-hydroxy-tetrahydrodipicolinate synthase